MDGQIIDAKYQVVRLLGRGGMGSVYEARHLGTGRRVAVKLIVPEALVRGGDIITRFQREARASGAIDSQHVVQVLDTGVDPKSQSPYMVMEYLTGEDLQQTIERVGPLPTDAALRVMAQACIGLQRAHEAGIVHRDIKSANMYLSAREGGEMVVKILDFGIAKVRADQFAAVENHGLTKTGSMLGSPLYMSPEQARGLKDLDSRSDIWSLGVAFYEALTGLTPNAHCETIGQLILAICSESPRPVQQKAPWTPPEVAAIVHKALAMDPKERFQSASEMNNAIAALLQQGSAIHSSMLRPLTPEARAYVAPRYAATPWPPSEPQLSQSPFASTTANTTAGVGSHTQENVAGLPRRGTSARWAVPLAVVVVGGASIFGWRSHVASSAAATALASASTPAPPPVAAPSASVALPAPLPRIAHVSVLPQDAVAVLDGQPATVRNGEIEIDGAVGSVHHVSLTANGQETSVDVVIAENGAIPASVEVPKPAHASHGAGATAHGTGAASATGKTPDAPPATTHEPQKPPPTTHTATAPTVDRTM